MAAAGLSVPTSPATAASTPSVDRPSIMQRQDLQHQGDVLHATPARPGAFSSAAAPHTAVPAASPQTAYNGSGLQREVFGFAPYWAVTSGSTLSGGSLSDVEYDKVTTFAYFGLTIQGNGSFAGDAGMTAWNSQQLADLATLARRAGDHLQLVVKQFDQATICQVLTNPAASAAATNNTVNAVKGRGWDGANVDFEGQAGTCANGMSAQTAFTNWISSLGAAMHSSGLLLTVDAYSGSASWDGGFMKIGDLAPSVDAFFIMAYDMNAPNDLPNAPLAGPYTYTDTSSVQQYLSKVRSKTQVILGVPYYGYKFSTSGNGFNAPVTGGTATPGYADVRADIACASGPPDNLAYNWDGPSSTPWLAWWSPASGDPCGGNHGSWRETYFDDATSLGYKYELVNAQDIRGAGIWSLGDDHGYTDLWNTIEQHFAGARWSSWYPLGGSGAGGARVAVGTNSDGRLEAFVRGSDNTIRHTWQTSAGGGWAGQWYSLGGSLAGDPVVVVNSDGRLEVFAVGRDGRLWHAWQWTAGGGWSGFYPFEGSWTGRPAGVTNSDGRLEVFVRGTDNGISHLWQLSPGGGWTQAYPLNTTSTSDPATARAAGGGLEAYVRGNDNALWHDRQTSPGGGWSGWTSLGGSLAGAPTETTNSDGRLEVFARGTDGAIWHTWQGTPGGSWVSFASLGGSLAGDPVGARNADGRLEIFAAGSDGSVQHVWQMMVDGGWVSWHSIPPFTAGTQPAVGANSDGRLEVIDAGTDSTVWHAWQTVPNGGW